MATFPGGLGASLSALPEPTHFSAPGVNLGRPVWSRTALILASTRLSVLETVVADFWLTALQAPGQASSPTHFSQQSRPFHCLFCLSKGVKPKAVQETLEQVLAGVHGGLLDLRYPRERMSLKATVVGSFLLSLLPGPKSPASDRSGRGSDGWKFVSSLRGEPRGLRRALGEPERAVSQNLASAKCHS